jgi:tetratricopeptide (TPR) repeat protein
MNSTAPVEALPLRKRHQKYHLLPRIIFAGALVLVLGASLPHRQAAGAAAFVLVASFTKSSARRLVWFVLVAIGAALAGWLPWWFAAVAIFLDVLGVPIFLAACDFLDQELHDPDPWNAPFWRLTVLRAARIAAPIAAAGVAAALDRSWQALAVAAVPALFASRGWFRRAILLAAILGTTLGWSAPLLAILAVAVAAAISPCLGRQVPPLIVLLPSTRLRHPRVALSLLRVDRALRRGELYRARRLARHGVKSTPEFDPFFRLRTALASYEEDHFQDALDDVSTIEAEVVEGDVTHAATLIKALTLTSIGRPRDAAEMLIAFLAEPAITKSHHQAAVLVLCEAFFEAERFPEAAEAAARAAALAPRYGFPAVQLRAHRFLGEALRHQRRFDEADAAVQRGLATLNTFWIRRMLEEDALARVLAGPRARQVLELARLMLLDMRIQLDAKRLDDEGITNFLNYSIADEVFAQLGEWRDFADIQLVRAQLFALRGRLEEGTGPALESLRELDRHRYELRSQRDRAAWAQKVHAALAVALDLAERQGHTALAAELLEMARVQALPLVPMEVTGADIELGPAPVVRVRGESRVPRFPVSNRPEPIDLEVAAASAAGAGAWWLSYWCAGESFYWSVVPPEGPVTSGRISGETGFPLATALAQLKEALPLPRQEESPAELDLRMAASPLVHDREAERELFSSLGTALLPPPLVTELHRRLRHKEPPLPLAIAAAPELGFIPWSLVAVPVDSAFAEPVRLVEVADWVLAPAASLIAALAARRFSKGPFPLRVAIIDTWAGGELDELHGARMLAEGFHDAEIDALGGRHWTERIATRSHVFEALARAGPQASALFACHALPAEPGRSSTSGLVVAPDAGTDKPSLLTAADLFALKNGHGAIPAQVYLQACDTTDLASASGGEWLALAPAFLAAGARVVVATVFPLNDTAHNDPMVAALLRGDDAPRAVRHLQREQLARWRAGGAATLTDAPVVWGAYACCELSPDGVAQRAKMSTNTPNPVSFRTGKALARAARSAKGLRGSVVTTADFLSEYVYTETEIADHSPVRIFGLGLGLPILARVAGRHERADDMVAAAHGKHLAPTKELVRVLSFALAEARREGRRVEPDHVVRVALREDCGARRLAKYLRLLRVTPSQALGNLAERRLAQRLLGAETSHSNRLQLFESRESLFEFRGFVSETLEAAGAPVNTAIRNRGPRRDTERTHISG